MFNLSKAVIPAQAGMTRLKSGFENAYFLSIKFIFYIFIYAIIILNNSGVFL